MCEQLSRLTGPEFLDAVAEAELAKGNGVNADFFEQRAREWRQLQADHDQTAQRIASQQQALDRAHARVRQLEAQVAAASAALAPRLAA